MEGKSVKIYQENLWLNKISSVRANLAALDQSLAELQELGSGILDKSGIARATISAQAAKDELSSREQSILSYIFKSPRTRSELSIRFSRYFNSEELYGPSGVLQKMIAIGLIERTIDETAGRPVTWYKVTETLKTILDEEKNDE